MDKSLFNKILTVDPKAEVAHQNMMQQLIDEKWVSNEPTKEAERWKGKWGKLIKDSQIYPEALKKLITMAHKGDYNARGWTRNRLQKNDWASWLSK